MKRSGKNHESSFPGTGKPFRDGRSGNERPDRNRYLNIREEMVREQIVARGISNKKVIDAILKVPREKYAGKDYSGSAYDDRPLPIGYGQTISQPYIVALMTELLELSGDEKVLEIGTGSGYQTAILAEVSGQVYSVEIIEPLYKSAVKNLSGYSNVKLKFGDGYNGWEEFSPFERIILTAAPEKIPQPITDQLAEDGILVVPEGPAGWGQSLLKITKKDGRLSTRHICDVAFVPLTRSS
jgi:protein-L-isoaspartate(D-aspartate) O-methyltransferase